MRLKIRCDGKSTVLLQKILEPNGALGSHFHKTRLNRTFGGSLAGTSIQFINDGRALLQRQLARSPVGLCGERQRAQLDSAGRRPAVGGARVQRSIGEPVVRGGLRRARLVRRRSGAWGVLGEAGGTFRRDVRRMWAHRH
jgi:hypothetical protein